jgi:hypothetical protein
MATLSPTPLDDLLTICRAHALQEPVAVFSLALVWLVGSLHGARSLWFGEAGILCLMWPIVKYLLVFDVFCLAGVLGLGFAGVLFGCCWQVTTPKPDCVSFFSNCWPSLWLPSRRSGWAWRANTSGGRKGKLPGDAVKDWCGFPSVPAVVSCC